MDDVKELRLIKDELTGLLDKQSFYACAQELLKTAAFASEYSIVFFNLENFKTYNANYGFEKGDELLVIIAQIIQDTFKGQLISRLSGDHFAVCTNSTQIIPNIKSVRDKIKLVQRNINLEIKAGIYICSEGENDVIRCCDRARIACISIKKKYDVEYKIYDEELEGTLQKKQAILDDLDEAIEKRYLQVYYQPIVRTFTGEVCAWEALVRWIDPEKGMVYPNEFIPVLEEYRLITKMDTFVMEEVFSKYQKQMQKSEDVVPVSMNLSRIDFEVVDLVAFIDELMKRYNCPKNMFHFEVTESALMENPQFILEQISKMRANGYQVWMDDFGSGYSSLNLLKNYNFDLVKIDMDFLSNFDTSESGKIILRHIVSMIKNLNIHTLVEGVETQEQYDFMQSIGCEMIQGYFIGRPMPFISGLECVQKDGRTLEGPSDRVFFEKIGKIDVLKHNPVQNIANTSLEEASPLAIIIKNGKKWKFIYANAACREVYRGFGMETLEQAVAVLESKGNSMWSQKEHFIQLCLSSKETNKYQSMDFIQEGRLINLRARHIVEDKKSGKDAFLISFKMVSKLLSGNYETKVVRISNKLFSLYECVELYGLDQNYYENIYLNDSRLHIAEKDMRAKEIIGKIRDNLVHEDDREEFATYFDLDTVEERIERQPAKLMQRFFRILDVNGNYKWKTVALSLIRFENLAAVLCCVCESCEEVAKRMGIKLDAEAKVIEAAQPKSTTQEDKNNADSILQMLPVGVFWKDKERRFLGANKMFLDYYNMKSSDLVGKTDEDMGWHIDPEQFKRDEISVINDGIAIQDVRGECIVRGRVRQILVTKKPYIVNGKVEGLVGFFEDITDELAEHDRLETLSKTDELTGLYNRRGFQEVVQKYINQYEKEKRDFALVVMDIDRFKRLNDMSGHDFGDLVLQKTAQVLRGVAGESSVVCRFGGDEFLLLHQLRSLDEVDGIKQEIRLGISKISEIGEIETNIQVSIGAAIYSQCGNMSECFDTADSEMYADKEQRRMK